MPEGDALRRAAAALRTLVGEHVEVETPHPRAAVKRIAERLDGRRLERVDAVGKNLLLRFEGGLVLRSHLRMTGRWRVQPRDSARNGRPWLVLRGREREAVLWNGPVLELRDDAVRSLGPDILDEEPDFVAMLRLFRAADDRREVGDALLDQRIVAGIGNLWKAEALWAAGVSPWRPLASLSDADLQAVLDHAHRLMRASVERTRPPRHSVYRRRVCSRCGTRIEVRGQGDDNRTAYWCPSCQA